MDIFALPPVAAALNAAYSVVAGLVGLFSPVTGGASAAIVIVVVTMLLRTALIPVGRSQMSAQLNRRRIAPKLQELQRKYKNNREVLMRKTQELYVSEKVSPFAGMLPTLLQAPILSLVYGLFLRPEIGGHANGLLSQHLFGVPLGTSLGQLLSVGPASPGLLVFVVLLAAIAVVAWLSRRTTLAMTPAATPGATGAGIAHALSWMPFITVVFAAFVPLAATLYLTVTTSWTLVERTILRRRLSATPRVALT